MVVLVACESSVETDGGSDPGGAAPGGAAEGGAGASDGGATAGGAPEGGASEGGTSEGGGLEGGASMGGNGEGGGGAEPLFPELDDGPWLIGWSGGLDHYSWVLFTYTAADEGTAVVIDTECTSCTPYFDCSGMTTFSIAGASTVDVPLPAPCAQIVSLDFGALGPTRGFPPSALQHAAISTGDAQLDGFLYPSEQCTPSPPDCGDPFQ